MAKHPGSHRVSRELTIQESTFPAKIKAVQKAAKKALDPQSRKPLSVKERGRHQSALKAANRVESRLRNPSGGKKGTPKAKTSGTSPGSVGETRRAPFEKATGTAETKRRLQGVRELAKAGRR